MASKPAVGSLRSVWTGKRRHALEDELRSLRAEVARSVRASESAAEAAQRAAALAAGTDDDERSGRRLFWVTISCLLAIAAGIYLTLTGVKAFTDPDALSINFGNVSTLVSPGGATPKGDLPFASDARILVQASFDVGDSSAIYRFYFPEDLAGQKFLIVLDGSARLKSPTLGTGSGPQLEVKAVQKACSQDLGGTSPCQVFSGALSSRTITPTASPCDLGLESSAPMSVVELAGKTRFTSEPDWAHTLSIFPSTVSDALLLTSATRSWRGMDLGDWYASINQYGCRSAKMPIDQAVVRTSTNPPTRRADDQIQADPIWEGDEGVQSATVVTRRNNAESRADFYLAIGAALAGLGIGLIPVVDEARRSWRKQRRRQVRSTIGSPLP